jgi:hypothetical protein
MNLWYLANYQMQEFYEIFFMCAFVVCHIIQVSIFQSPAAIVLMHIKFFTM